MNRGEEIALFAQLLAGRMDVAWTLFLLLTRWVTFLSICPGLGMGLQGLSIRIPAAVMLAASSLAITRLAPVPQDTMIMLAGILGECLFGTMMGFVPVLLVSGAHAAGHLASTTMGLNGSQLIDPTAGGSLSDLSRIYGDLVVIFFLLLDGHHMAVSALTGAGQELVPGSFLLGDSIVRLLIDRSSHLFWVGVMLSAPVIAALFLTNFIMALLSKAVPTVNVFIVSFPLTIGVGLTLAVFGLPEFYKFYMHEFQTLENSYEVIVSSMRFEGLIGR